MTKFKICGLRDVYHAITAADAGADYLGFNFVEGVRRQLQPDEAENLITDYRSREKDGEPALVGLFANQPADFINAAIKSCGLDYVQLCGDEPVGFWATLDAPVMRQVRVMESLPRVEAVTDALRKVEMAVSRGHMALLDKHQSGSLGGTGKTFDWTIAWEIARQYPVHLAGGLNPENVGSAIKSVSPLGVDVSSGVETEGVKDADKINAFARAVRMSK
ncbi:MAG: phosphoribosylanthranilate isomerase [SAR202 cluster bacterium]|jgi:phosphoribosylanthranilate isomerase|nr:phosphoribosylanthranilate isomerase [SAR202 cluster bacterium]MDP6514782.1 phosphoribosylanthranilate isomerase [SAR202 cluster bacterium]MDP6713208.1 phosphoribosylanthranilate isomerase [SAR202 cluster bacterium]